MRQSKLSPEYLAAGVPYGAHADGERAWRAEIEELNALRSQLEYKERVTKGWHRYCARFQSLGKPVPGASYRPGRTATT